MDLWLLPVSPHSFIQHILLNIYYVSGTILDAGDPAVNKTNENLYPPGAYTIGRDKQ